MQGQLERSELACVCASSRNSASSAHARAVGAMTLPPTARAASAASCKQGSVSGEAEMRVEEKSFIKGCDVRASGAIWRFRPDSASANAVCRRAPTPDHETRAVYERAARYPSQAIARAPPRPAQWGNASRAHSKGRDNVTRGDGAGRGPGGRASSSGARRQGGTQVCRRGRCRAARWR
jgi:hypothetical protein